MRKPPEQGISSAVEPDPGMSCSPGVKFTGYLWMLAQVMCGRDCPLVKAAPSASRAQGDAETELRRRVRAFIATASESKIPLGPAAACAANSRKTLPLHAAAAAVEHILLLAQPQLGPIPTRERTTAFRDLLTAAVLDLQPQLMAEAQKALARALLSPGDQVEIIAAMSRWGGISAAAYEAFTAPKRLHLSQFREWCTDMAIALAESDLVAVFVHIRTIQDPGSGLWNFFVETVVSRLKPVPLEVISEEEWAASAFPPVVILRRLLQVLRECAKEQSKHISRKHQAESDGPSGSRPGSKELDYAQKRHWSRQKILRSRSSVMREMGLMVLLAVRSKYELRSTSLAYVRGSSSLTTPPPSPTDYLKPTHTYTKNTETRPAAQASLQLLAIRYGLFRQHQACPHEVMIVQYVGQVHAEDVQQAKSVMRDVAVAAMFDILRQHSFMTDVLKAGRGAVQAGGALGRVTNWV
ncbi:hypothetical protein VOLCADRAFT_99153, partial [Volvox carteri f. nagariensis]